VYSSANLERFTMATLLPQLFDMKFYNPRLDYCIVVKLGGTNAESIVPMDIMQDLTGLSEVEILSQTASDRVVILPDAFAVAEELRLAALDSDDDVPF
jgi:hypothetical protein